MSDWSVTQLAFKIPKLNKPLLITGLPGIGNVGKVAVDFMIEELDAERLYEFFSFSLPHSVFVTENHLIEPPSIMLYFKKRPRKKNDLVFLAGDVQPIDERSCYSFSDVVLNYFLKLKGSHVVTIGGIGLPAIPKKPKVYCTGTEKKIVELYASQNVDSKLHGVVGPIIGVTGVLLGLSQRRKIPAVSLLAETFSHPMYLGIRGAREVVAVLKKVTGLEINIADLDREIKELEAEAVSNAKSADLAKALRGIKKSGEGDVSYIG